MLLALAGRAQLVGARIVPVQCKKQGQGTPGPARDGAAPRGGPPALTKVAKRPVPAATSSARSCEASRPCMKSARGTRVERCMASCRPTNSVSVEVSYTLAAGGEEGGGGGSLLRFTAVQPSLPDGNGWLAARWLGGGRRSVPCLRHHRKPALQPPSSANYKLHLRSPPTSVARRCRRPPAPTRGRAQPAVALVVEGLLVVLGQEAALEPDLVGHAGIPALGAAIEQGEAAGMAAPALPPALPYADTAR